MNSSATLTDLADRLHRNLAAPEDKAEFIRLVAGEKDVGVLKSLLAVNYDYVGTILQRIIELLPNDLKARLSLALWKYNNGLDDEALELFNELRELAPHDQDILRADIWFSFSCGATAILAKCRILLKAFPKDAWGRKICRQIQNCGKLTELESPNWDNPWQDLINRPWRPQLT